MIYKIDDLPVSDCKTSQPTLKLVKTLQWGTELSQVSPIFGGNFAKKNRQNLPKNPTCSLLV